MLFQQIIRKIFIQRSSPVQFYEFPALYITNINMTIRKRTKKMHPDRTVTVMGDLTADCLAWWRWSMSGLQHSAISYSVTHLAIIDRFCLALFSALELIHCVHVSRVSDFRTACHKSAVSARERRIARYKSDQHQHRPGESRFGLAVRR